jgi:hypothetical protein
MLHPIWVLKTTQNILTHHLEAPIFLNNGFKELPFNDHRLVLFCDHFVLL